ncbi:MAG TPA: response regulator transcription factor [Puia sp.]|jgi:DNA-binding NarL/FixJ family response regulator|nr:response regulator transcription factor [Puia sp.]
MKSEKKIVLIVDQSLLVLQRMIPMLEALSNVELVVHAGSYREAMGLLGDMRPDMILLDIDLPDHRGIELLRAIREKYENIIVFILTNFVSEQHRSLCQKLGAHKFFDKSVEYEQLTEAVAYTS